MSVDQCHVGCEFISQRSATSALPTAELTCIHHTFYIVASHTTGSWS